MATMKIEAPLSSPQGSPSSWVCYHHPITAFPWGHIALQDSSCLPPEIGLGHVVCSGQGDDLTIGQALFPSSLATVATGPPGPRMRWHGAGPLLTPAGHVAQTRNKLLLQTTVILKCLLQKQDLNRSWLIKWVGCLFFYSMLLYFIMYINIYKQYIALF